MVKSITVKGYTYTTGLTRQDVRNSISEELQCNCFDKAAANFDKIDINQDSVLSEEEITKFKRKRITKGVLIGLGVAAATTLITLGISKGCKTNLNQNLNSSIQTSISSSTSSGTKYVMSRAEFVDWWYRNNDTLPGTCPKDFGEYIADLYDDYLSGRFHI